MKRIVWNDPIKIKAPFKESEVVSIPKGVAIIRVGNCSNIPIRYTLNTSHSSYEPLMIAPQQELMLDMRDVPGYFLGLKPVSLEITPFSTDEEVDGTLYVFFIAKEDK